jgi:DNA-binding MarR family transcriptional regulator
MGATKVPAASKLDHEVGELLFRLMESTKDHFFVTAADLGLTPTQASALHSLDEPCPMRELAQNIGHDASHVTAIVDKLESQGLVERQADPHDRRVKRLSLTAEGRALKERLLTDLFDRLPHLDRLSVPQRRELRDLLRVAVGEELPAS